MSVETPAGAAGRLRVLIVDHNLHSLEAFKNVLSRARADLEFSTSTNGEEADSLARRAHAAGRPFALVITDHQMPGMTGAQLIADLEREHIVRAGILVSGAERAEAELHRLAPGAHFLRRPCASSELLALIERAIGP